MTVHDALPPGALINGDNSKYRVDRILGSGGFATTYLAHDLVLQREVAIKEFFPRGVAKRVGGGSVSARSDQLEKDYRWGLERFRREAMVVAKFRHPNIVRAYNVFEAHNTAYLVLEYVEGADLEVWLKRRREKLRQEEFDQLLPGLLQALALIHAGGVLHRDIKPANIYLRARDGVPVFLDFGASKFDFGEKTATTAAIVSRGYSPQEAYVSDARLQGAWTDIYGLAATIYFALSDRVPQEAPERVLNDKMVPASRLPVSGFRPEFLAAVDWGLRVNPADRPQSVGHWVPMLFHGSPQQIDPYEIMPQPMPAPSTARIGAISGITRLFTRRTSKAKASVLLPPPLPVPSQTRQVQQTHPQTRLAPPSTQRTAPPSATHGTAHPVTPGTAPAAVHLAPPPAPQGVAPPAQHVTSPPVVPTSARQSRPSASSAPVMAAQSQHVSMPPHQSAPRSFPAGAVSTGSPAAAYAYSYPAPRRKFSLGRWEYWLAFGVLALIISTGAGLALSSGVRFRTDLLSGLWPTERRQERTYDRPRGGGSSDFGGFFGESSPRSDRPAPAAAPTPSWSAPAPRARPSGEGSRPQNSGSPPPISLPQ